MVRAEGDHLVLEKRRAVLARVRRQFSVVPDGADLADELGADRRAAALRGRSWATQKLYRTRA